MGKPGYEYTEAEMLDYMENEYTIADESFEDVLHDYLMVAKTERLDSSIVIDLRLELIRRGCLFVYTPGEDCHLAKYKVRYKGSTPYSSPCWETALETDIPEPLWYLTGELLDELIACEPVADKVEIVIYGWDGHREFYRLSELPIRVKVRIEHIERHLSYAKCLVGDISNDIL